MQSGLGADSAISRATSINPTEVKTVIDQGLTQDMAQSWANFYNNAAVFGRGGAVAPARANLIQTILKNWPN